jgi:hypothetical protein
VFDKVVLFKRTTGDETTALSHPSENLRKKMDYII